MKTWDLIHNRSTVRNPPVGRQSSEGETRGPRGPPHRGVRLAPPWSRVLGKTASQPPGQGDLRECASEPGRSASAPSSPSHRSWAPRAPWRRGRHAQMPPCAGATEKGPLHPHLVHPGNSVPAQALLAFRLLPNSDTQAFSPPANFRSPAILWEENGVKIKHSIQK